MLHLKSESKDLYSLWSGGETLEVTVCQTGNVHHDKHVGAVERLIDTWLAAKPCACVEVTFNQRRNVRLV